MSSRSSYFMSVRFQNNNFQYQPYKAFSGKLAHICCDLQVSSRCSYFMSVRFQNNNFQYQPYKAFLGKLDLVTHTVSEPYKAFSGKLARISCDLQLSSRSRFSYFMSVRFQNNNFQYQPFSQQFSNIYTIILNQVFDHTTPNIAIIQKISL